MRVVHGSSRYSIPQAVLRSSSRRPSGNSLTLGARRDAARCTSPSTYADHELLSDRLVRSVPGVRFRRGREHRPIVAATERPDDCDRRDRRGGDGGADGQASAVRGPGPSVENVVEPVLLGLGVGAVHGVLRVSVEEGRQLTLDVPRAHDGSSHCWASAAIPRLACFLTDPRETPSVSAISASL